MGGMVINREFNKKKEDIMLRRFVIALPLYASFASIAAAEFDAEPLHSKFVDAFNNRQWEDVKPLLAEDSVFHRADAGEVYSGPDAIVGHFEQTIGGEWNVKFAELDSESAFTGNDGRVVERGDFAITAGADDSSCYRGSYMMTWAPQEGDDWQLQLLSWQDVETELENCK
jgi:ketosteroid isomerase-like protein